MKALMFVLNNADLLPAVLEQFNSNGIRGCTIFDSNGMGRELAKRDDFQIMFGSLRYLLRPELEKTKTLFLILQEEKIPCVVSAIERVVGDLSQPGTGIVFTFPLDFVKGIKL